MSRVHNGPTLVIFGLGKGRGSGLYYHRGNGIFSKYSTARDRKKRSKTPITNRNYKHTGELDFKLRI